ncbi:hypothetical protein M427DRAFT_47392 [Gonapodya prolifera JEL478]|uniref:Uncharacterized protein n=1 Tax=Gonapodya prolifera (strain JEL478) TaxID=1344416 RepID=A0A139A4C0_GONPJ|nr:hypothetical protein M427DRAFT_47392 [Gonapodya prolifera JEL478]|eukprot:KXS11203.1 hypothetical protein M427DRAFT_47392 [Gonapodya prolifera JEL478]
MSKLVAYIAQPHNPALRDRLNGPNKSPGQIKVLLQIRYSLSTPNRIIVTMPARDPARKMRGLHFKSGEYGSSGAPGVSEGCDIGQPPPLTSPYLNRKHPKQLPLFEFSAIKSPPPPIISGPPKGEPPALGTGETSKSRVGEIPGSVVSYECVRAAPMLAARSGVQGGG